MSQQASRQSHVCPASLSSWHTSDADRNEAGSITSKITQVIFMLFIIRDRTKEVNMQSIPPRNAGIFEFVFMIE